MTPQEKAKELIDKFLLPITQQYVEQDQNVGKGEFKVAKQCALIAVDEVNNTLSGCNNYYELDGTIEYWLQVKQEIKSYDTTKKRKNPS